MSDGETCLKPMASRRHRPPPAVAPVRDAAAGLELEPLRGAAGRIAGNMSASLTIPLAASQRTLAVKVMDENRRIINQHRTLLGRGKVSYTHIIGWAIVKALAEMPALNHAYAEKDGQPFRVARAQVNLGIAVDVTARDGSRALLVPNIKNAGALDFQAYVTAFDDLVSRARTGKLTTADFQDTTISLTNPGTVGTMASNPAPHAGTGRHHRRRRHRLPGRIPGRGRRDARHPGHQQGDDAHLHLRSPHHSGRRIRPLPGQAASAAGWQRRLLRGDLRAPLACPTSRCAGRPIASRCCPA